ncbi:hypothetical protein Bca4012_020317 [Brassica carinata]
MESSLQHLIFLFVDVYLNRGSKPQGPIPSFHRVVVSQQCRAPSTPLIIVVHQNRQNRSSSSHCGSSSVEAPILIAGSLVQSSSGVVSSAPRRRPQLTTTPLPHSSATTKLLCHGVQFVSSNHCNSPPRDLRSKSSPLRVSLRHSQHSPVTSSPRKASTISNLR